MTQIIVTLENNTNPTKVRAIIEGLKGVFSTKIEENVEENNNYRALKSLPERLVSNSKTKQEREEWSRIVKQMAGSVTPDKLDLSDERTGYLLSK